MADRSDQKTVERDSVADSLTEEFGEDGTRSAEGEAESEGIVRSRVPTLESVFSSRTFLVRAALLLAGAFGAGFLPFVGGVVAVALGVFGMAFVIGLVASDARYLETATAGGLLGGALALLQTFSLAIASGGGARLASVGIGIGLVASLLGLYFGRDLRAGVTKDLDGGDDGPGY